MSDSFQEAVEEHFRGRRVRVVSSNSDVYVGQVERINNDRHVILRDARDPDAGENYGPVFVANAEAIVALDVGGEDEQVDVDVRDDQEGEPDQEDDIEEAPDSEFQCDVDGCDYATDSEQGLAIHQGRIHDGVSDEDDEDADDGPSEIWCGICGAGPFDGGSKLSGHHLGADHGGETVPLDHEPEERELVDEVEESDEDAHRIGDEIDVDDQEAEDDATDEDDEPDVDLPEDLTVDDVHRAVDEADIERNGDQPYLGALADVLELPSDRTRTVLVKMGRYEDVIDAERRRTGPTGGDRA